MYIMSLVISLLSILMELKGPDDPSAEGSDTDVVVTRPQTRL